MGAIFSKLSIPDTKNKKLLMAEHEAEAYRLISTLQSFNNNVPKLKESLLNNQNLLYLSKEYLNNAVLSKKFLASLKPRLSKARYMQAIILQALKCYHKEDQHKYSLTLSMLKEYNETGHSMAGLLVNEFSLISEHLQSIVKQLNSKMNEVKRKLSSTKKWKKVWKVLHTTVFISVLALSVILAGRSAPPWVTKAATVGSTVIYTAEKWIDSIWEDRLDALKNEKDAILMMMKGNYMCGVGDLASIQTMVDRLDVRIRSVLENVGLALVNQEEDIALKMAMNDIELSVGEIGKWINDVEMKVNACDSEIGKTVGKFLNAIISD